MAIYLSPGVYVEEVATGAAPIAGVGTSTAGFIGITSPEVDGSASAPPQTTQTTQTVEVAPIDGAEGQGVFTLPAPSLAASESFALIDDPETYEFKVSTSSNKRAIKRFEQIGGKIELELQTPLSSAASISGSYQVQITTPIASATPPPSSVTATPDPVHLCTNFTEFKQVFGDFSTTPGQNTLAHAVYGFFRNGGTRCYVRGIAHVSNIEAALEEFEAIDEIAIVAAPGITTSAAYSAMTAHCEQMGDRVAIFDTPEVVDITTLQPGTAGLPGNTDYAALYFPWIQVFDPVAKAAKAIPPSGHIAGIYARVDTQRGVHKAPANETILGAVGLAYNISKSKQDGLNPQGVNCIRNLNGNIRVWGARTWGGNDNGEFKYINVRRLFNYLRESIDESTQWTVFEPNSPELWAAIRRNVTAFLTLTWRSGALFGSSPEQAFYVKCDAENNPPEVREQGQVIIDIGVAVVKPAEFVIFRIGQKISSEA